MNELENLKHISVYLGNTCNFDCTYCDREYIAKDIGGQTFKATWLDLLDNYMEKTIPNVNSLKHISLHGGEPFLFVSRMDKIMSRLYDKWIAGTDRKLVITTNGSLIKDNVDFMQKWGKHLRLTISYDFMFQEQNRDSLDVVEMSKIIRENGATMQWQFVIPTDDKRAFSMDSLSEIVKTCNSTGCNTINLIPLRHRRGARKFEVIIDSIPLNEWFNIFLQMITILHTKGIRLYVDGTYGNIDEIDKFYYNNHNKMILSPDGYIYPEYDFLEYKRKEFRIGQWSNGKLDFVPQYYRQQNEKNIIREGCYNCLSKNSCGLKYLYKMFDEEPVGNCVLFYKMIDTAVAYAYKLQQKDSVFEWIGIE